MSTFYPPNAAVLNEVTLRNFALRLGFLLGFFEIEFGERPLNQPVVESIPRRFGTGRRGHRIWAILFDAVNIMPRSGGMAHVNENGHQFVLARGGSVAVGG